MPFVHPRDYRQTTPTCCDDCVRRDAWRRIGADNGYIQNHRTDVPAEYVADYEEVYWAAWRLHHSPVAYGRSGGLPVN